MPLRIFITVAALFVFVSELHAQTVPTFNKEIVRVLQQHCQVCHRPGNIAPFSLLTYQDVLPRVRLIRDAVESKQMPPWKPVNAHGVFEGERALSEREIQTIVQWASNGAPEGVASDLPEPARFPDTWAAGEPDLVAQSSEPYELPATSDDIYRCFSVPLSSSSDLYVRGYEVIPGNRTIVHHVLIFLDETGQSLALDNADPGPGYTCFGGAGFLIGLGALGGWAPGASPVMFPLGAGVKIAKGSRVVIQVHYSPIEGAESGEAPAPDLTRVGIYLSAAQLQEVSFLPAVNPFFQIPAGNSRHAVRAFTIIPRESDLIGIAPHMHLLGREAEVTALFPSGQSLKLIQIDDWDFHWQNLYTYKQPIRLPAGTVVEMVAHYDNSTNNPHNPSNPPVAVRWGERTVDEMCLTFLSLKSPTTPGLNIVPFSITDRGTTSITTESTSSAPQVGYARATNPSGAAPSGLAIFGYRQNGILISEAGVPASKLLTRARIYAETNAAAKTGLAIANPNSDPAVISFFFTDSNGQDSGAGTMTVLANGQKAAFVNEEPFNGAASFTGTLTISSSKPVSAVALRGFLNERSEFLLTTMPVVDLASTSTGSSVFPHFADGAGWTTQIMLVNPTDTVISGTLRFTDSNGQSASLTLNGQTAAGSFAYSLPPRSAQQFLTAGTSNTVRAGTIWLTPDANDAAPAGSLIFSYRKSNVRVTEAGISALTAGSAFRIYAEASGDFAAGELGSMQSGFAITNTSSAPAALRLELINFSGASVSSATLTLGANTQVGTFLNQIPGFDLVSLPFRGLLRLTSASPIAVVGLRGRYNERGDFLITTTPPVSESAPTLAGDSFFAHFADAGGYSTQFILFGSGASASISGTVRFMSQAGQPLDLRVR